MAGDIFHNRGSDETLDVLFPWKFIFNTIIILVRIMVQTQDYKFKVKKIIAIHHGASSALPSF